MIFWVKSFLFVKCRFTRSFIPAPPNSMPPLTKAETCLSRHIPWIFSLIFVLHHIILSWYHAYYTAFYYMTLITDVSNQVLLPHHVAESPVPAVQMWQYGQRPPFRGPRRRSRRSARQSIQASHHLSPQAPLLLLVCVWVYVCVCARAFVRAC